MARQHSYDDLDEMNVPASAKGGDLDEIHVPKKAKEPKKGQGAKTPRQLEREAKKRKETLKIVMIVAAIFLVVVAAVIAVGIAMGHRAGVDSPSKTVTKALPDETRTMFLNEQNIPELSAEGVKGLLKEAYFTVDGDLAVTLKLSNGTASEQEVVRVACTIFNEKNETVARQTIDEFDPAVKVPAGGYSEAYFIIDEKNVALPKDPLSQLGTTLEIGSNPTDGSAKDNAVAEDPNAPKAIADGRTYYENTGNIPELSAEGVKGTVIRAQYTNDGSLAVTLSLSNGMDADHQVTKVDVSIANGDGATIGSQSFTTFDSPCIVRKQSYSQLDLIIDTANVPLKDDPLSTLSCTVSIGTGPVVAATETSADAVQEQ